jgi:hypothetical protein
MQSSEHDKRVSISVPVGDLIDRITILEIKKGFIKSDDQIRNISRELTSLTLELEQSGLNVPLHLIESLRGTNRKIFMLMEELFPLDLSDSSYAKLSKETVDLNIIRAEIKRDINLKSGSELMEEKSYFVNE